MGQVWGPLCAGWEWEPPGRCLGAGTSRGWSGPARPRPGHRAVGLRVPAALAPPHFASQEKQGTLSGRSFLMRD